MPGEKINIAGLKLSKTAAIGGGAAIVVVGAIYIRRQNASKAAAAQQAAAQTAGSNTGIDPATGYPYGSTEDAAALGNQNNYVTPYSDAGIYGGGGNTYPYGYSNSYPSNTQPGGFTNNAQWAQYVESYLESNNGADPATVGNAIGKYITGQPVTQDMITIINNAIAIGGYPPVSGPNGNPPSYVTSNTGNTNPTEVNVPNVVGLRLADAWGALQAAGLNIGGAAQVKGESQVIVSQSPVAGTQVAKGSTVTVTAKKV